MTTQIQDRINTVFKMQQEHKYQLKNSSSEYRKNKLKKFKEIMLSQKKEIACALAEDFGKSEHESYLTEVLPVMSMINLYLKKLDCWMKPKKISTGPLFIGTQTYVSHEAKGNTLIISPWNYPFHLAVYPVLTNFSAGNTAIVKPSEFTPATNKIMTQIFRDVFAENEVCVIEGAVEETHALLAKPFDHIFFTGSTPVGKIIMEKAAAHLASVSLELGGKSPTIICDDYDLEHAAKRIIWGKHVNSGQTCIAPDFIMVSKGQEKALIGQLKMQIQSAYPGDFGKNTDYCRIITQRHAQRLNNLIQDAISKGAVLEHGGEYDEGRVITPTLLSNVSNDMLIMQDEIFGPILPILTYDKIDECISFIQKIDNPLSLYVFSNNDDVVEKIRKGTCSGGFVVNDTILHAGHGELPFGGAGKSGIGKYHGQYGFEEFSNARGVLKRKFDSKLSFFYPPYDKTQMKVIEKLFKYVNRLL